MGTFLSLAFFLIVAIIIVKLAFHALIFILAFIKVFWKPLLFYAACALSAFFSYKIGLHDKFTATSFDIAACIVFVLFAPLFFKKK